jgi:hypothetical protein
MMQFSKFLVLAGLTGLLGACASAPTQEMMEAREGIRNAEAAGAGRYAAEQLARARRAVSDAERDLDLGAFASARKAARESVRQANDAQGLAMLVSEAVVAVERARSRGVVVDTADQAIAAAIVAGRRGEREYAQAFARRATELARAAEDADLLASARGLIQACRLIPGKESVLERASLALSEGKGPRALSLAEEACALPARP